MTETYAGMLARTLPELGSRELKALACENSSNGLRNIAIRAEDAAGLALPSERIKQAIRNGGQPWQGWLAAYWAALP